MAQQSNPTASTVLTAPAIPAVPSDMQSFGSSMLTSANQLSVAGTSMTTLVQTARVSALKRAATAAAAIYGANSTEAAAANQSVTTAQAKTGQLQILTQKASTPQPAITSTGWALHGRVYDANLNPQERYTVFLVDEQKNYLSDYGFSYTDATGYFLIQYSGSTASGSSSGNQTAADSSNTSSASSGEDKGFIDLHLLSGIEDPQETSAGSGSSSTAAAPAPAISQAFPQAFIEVCDANANPVYSSTTAFTPVTGQAMYQVVTLPASGQPLGDPPAEVRAVAMPPATSKTTTTRKGSSTKKQDG
jgi:hypothetical protein